MTQGRRKTAAEFLGTALLLAIVVGSGVMAENLTDGDEALALLANTIATGAGLAVLILVFGGLSGAHFNPAVTAVFAARGEIGAAMAAAYVAAQIAGGIAGVALAHAMFGLDLIQAGAKAREGAGQALGELVATFGLVLTILGAGRYRPQSVPFAVGLYITAAYWFTSSTSFANPAVTIARALSDTFAGIRPIDAPAFIAAQIAGAMIAFGAARFLFDAPSSIDAVDEGSASKIS